MGSEPLLRFDSSELIFHVEPNKQLSSSIHFSNDTRNHVAFKILSTNPKKYGVRPRMGILSPGSALDVAVTTHAHISCKDKFMIQSIVISPAAALEDVREIFNKGPGSDFKEHKLRVVFHNLDSNDRGVASQPRDTMKLLDVQPTEIKFPFELKKEISCLLQLTNATEIAVAYMVKTSDSKYSIEPNIGVISPQSTTAIKVKMKLKFELPSRSEHKDELLVRSMAANTSATINEDIILDMFDKAGSSVQEYKVQTNYTNVGELILRGLASVLITLVSWYLMRKTVSLIWSLVVVLVMLIVKMVKKLVSDSVEDWIVKAMLYVFMHLLFGRKANIDVQ